MQQWINIFLALIVAFLVYYIYMALGGADLKEGYIFPGATQCDDVCSLSCWGYPEYCKKHYLDYSVAGLCGCRWSNEKGMGVPTQQHKMDALYGGAAEKWLAQTGKKQNSLIFH